MVKGALSVRANLRHIRVTNHLEEGEGEILLILPSSYLSRDKLYQHCELRRSVRQ